MSMTARDRRIILILVPLLLVGVFWFLIMGPKRDEAASLDDEIAQVETELEEQEALVSSLEAAKTSFDTEYASIVRLGKAVPSEVDMPSLLVQLERAAQGTNISFQSITAGDRTPAATVAPVVPGDGSTPPGGEGTQPAATGGDPAQSAPGQVAEGAGGAVNDANAASEGAALDDTTSQSTGAGLPVGGGEAGATATGGTGMPGLDSVPLELTFKGGFFDLADFFHKLKRYVRIDGQNFAISGRLVTIDGMSFAPASEGGKPGALESQINATVWLVPEIQGVTAGATPEGPAGVPADGGTPVTAPPAAAVTP